MIPSAFLLRLALADPTPACPPLVADLELPLAHWTRAASTVLEVDSACAGIHCVFVVTRVVKGDARPGDRLSHSIPQGTSNNLATDGRLLVWGDVFDTTMSEGAGPSRRFRLLYPGVGSVLRRRAMDGVDAAWYGFSGPVGPLPGGRHGVSCGALHALNEHGRLFDLAYFGGAVPRDPAALEQARQRVTQLVRQGRSWDALLRDLAPTPDIASEPADP